MVAALTVWLVAGGATPTAFGSATEVRTEAELKRAWENPRIHAISVQNDIFLRACRRGSPIRESPRPLRLDGNGHTIRQTCFEKRILRQDGTGFLVIKNVTLTRGGNDGPGAAVTTRGEILIQGLRDHREPRRGARRRDVRAAARDDHPLGDHRQPRQ